jgi:hypothetical protein
LRERRRADALDHEAEEQEHRDKMWRSYETRASTKR